MHTCLFCGTPNHTNYCFKCEEERRKQQSARNSTSQRSRSSSQVNNTSLLEENRRREQAARDAEEAARLAAIAAEKERQRRIELLRRHTLWLNGLTNETAKSVFIFNSVGISVHNHLDDLFSKPEEFYCQEGNITYNQKLLNFHRLRIDTKNNVTTFSDGRVFTRSGDRVYGNDGSFFIDPVPAHLNIPRNLELERAFHEKCKIAFEGRVERLKSNFKAGAIVTGFLLAVGHVVHLLNDNIFNPKPQMEPTPSELFFTTNVDLKLVRADNIAVGTLNTGSCVYVETSPAGTQKIYEVVVNNGTQEGLFKIHTDFLNATTSYNLGNCIAVVTPPQRTQTPVTQDLADKPKIPAETIKEDTNSITTAYYIVTATQLNLREGPGTGFEVLSTFMIDSCVRGANPALDTNGFIAVRAETSGRNFQNGYMSEKYLSPASAGFNPLNCIAIPAP